GLIALVLVVTRSSGTIRRQYDEITRQNRALAKSNRELARVRAEAESERDQAREVTEFLVSSFRRPDPDQDGRAVTVAAVLGSAVKNLETGKLAPATRATILGAVGATYRGLGLVKEAVGIWERALGIRLQVLGP